MQKQLIGPIVGYALYGLMAFVIFVYVLFPYDLLRQWLTETVSQGALQLSITRLGPTFLPGLQLRQVRLTAKDRQVPGEMLQLETIRLHPRLLPLLTGKLDARFVGTLYDGRVTGRIQQAVLKGVAVWESQMRFTAVDVAKHALIRQNGYIAVTGRLEGTATATIRANGLLQRGEGDFRMKPAVFAPQKAAQLLLQRDLACSTMSGKVAMTAQQWQLQNLTCEGDDVFIDVRGTVRPHQPMESSTLNLRFRLRSVTAFKRELALLGTLVRRSPDRRGELMFGLRGSFLHPRPVR